MFSPDFYPTPENVITDMLNGFNIEGKTILEPSAGKGNIVDYLLQNGASNVIACEKNEDLQKILATKCKIIADDFLTVESHQVSHIDFIIMNPPFSADEKHILHAWEIAPAGCQIIALCNLSTVKNPYNINRERLKTTIDNFGGWEDLGSCFSDSERKTGVEIALVKLKKPGTNYNEEFEGFFLEEDEEETQYNGLMPYNVVRDLVNRYVEAIKIFDKQLEAAVQMNSLTSSFYSSKISMSIKEEDKPKSRNEFKKDLQKSGWQFIFNKMNMGKYATRGLKEDINKFVETQTQIPFTMKNIYRMLEIVVGTTEQRMDKAILEVFDKLTTHYHENRFNVEGWKTNSHYLINEKFIIPGICPADQWTKDVVNPSYRSENFERIEDMMKALCYITEENYDNFISLYNFLRYEHKIYSGEKVVDYSYNDYSFSKKEALERAISKFPDAELKETKIFYGQWYDWGFFEVKAFKKGTMHFKFKNQDIWAKFNQRIAKIKGYPLYEAVKKEEKKKSAPSANVQTVKPVVLATFKIKAA